MAATNYLMITADDLGYSQERNEGIVECYKSKAITRSSLMVNAIAAEHAVSLAKACNLPMGKEYEFIYSLIRTFLSLYINICLVSMLSN